MESYVPLEAQCLLNGGETVRKTDTFLSMCYCGDGSRILGMGGGGGGGGMTLGSVQNTHIRGIWGHAPPPPPPPVFFGDFRPSDINSQAISISSLWGRSICLFCHCFTVTRPTCPIDSRCVREQIQTKICIRDISYVIFC